MSSHGIQVGDLTYTWQEGWSGMEPSAGFAHPGFALSSSGELYLGHPGEPVVIVLNSEGKQIRAFETPVVENHGLFIGVDNGNEYLWIVDNGKKAGVESLHPPQVLKCTLDGAVRQSLEKDDFEYEEGMAFSPTSCFFDSESGELWVADGYGSSLVTVFDSDYRVRMTLDGSDGLGRFSCPHGIWLDRRGPEKLVYIADRTNNRVQVYDTSGVFRKGLDSGLNTPSAFCSFGEILVIAELEARLVFLDGRDHLIGTVGDAPHNVAREGWPNTTANGVRQSPLGILKHGEFNSPHGITCDEEGSIYITEWLLGGRLIKLQRS